MFGHRFGRRNADHSRNCSTSSTSSAFEFFQVKYVYDCEKPAFASRVIIAGRVNASERNTVPGCFFRTSSISHSQNGTGFVCGLSTRNDGHARVAPAEHDVADRLPEALAVARVPVEVVDVLVALGRVLGVLQRAVGPVLEPLRVLRQPGMVGRGLEGEVERELHPVLAQRRDERREVVLRAEVGVDRVVPARGSADRPGAADVARRGALGVVPPLAVRLADRVDRRAGRRRRSRARRARERPRRRRQDRPTSAGRARTRRSRGRVRARRRSRRRLLGDAVTLARSEPRAPPRATRRPSPSPNSAAPSASSPARSAWPAATLRSCSSSQPAWRSTQDSISNRYRPTASTANAPRVAVVAERDERLLAPAAARPPVADDGAERLVPVADDRRGRPRRSHRRTLSRASARNRRSV